MTALARNKRVLLGDELGHYTYGTTDSLSFLNGGGETGALIRAHDWASTPLGPPEGWPAELKTLVGVMLGAAQPMFVAWGREARTMIYNDCYAEVLASKHPLGLGRCFDDVWAEAMNDLEPLFGSVYRGEPIHQDDITLHIDRGTGIKEAHFAFSYNPVRNATGEIVGLFCPCRDTTEEVIAGRSRDAERARMEQLFTHAPGFIAIVEGPEHRFTYVNEAYRQLGGSRDYLGRTVREVFPEIAGQGYYELLDLVYSSGQPERITGQSMRLDSTATTPSRQGVLDFVYQPVFDDQGAVCGIFIEGYETTERTRVEQTLRQSEARFRAAVDAVQGVLWTNSADGEMLGEQPGWSALTGQTRSQYEGYGWADAVHPDDQRPTIDAWRMAVDERRPFEFEHRVTRHDGHCRTFHIRAIPTFDDNGKITEWIGVHTDVTDERMAQDALLESEEHYRAAAELNPQVAWTATPDGLLDRVAERWQEWTGTTGLGATWGDGLHPDDLGYSTQAWVTSFSTGVPYDVEHRVKRVDGTFRWARSRAFPRRDAAGGIVKWYGSTEDVDEQKRAEQRLRDSEAQFRGVAEAMPGFVWTADDQGALEYTSPRWHAYSGSDPEDSNGAGWAAFVHPDDQPRAFERWQHSLVTGERYEIEFRLKARDGSYHWWLARARKHFDERVRWIGTATELDEIVAARDALSRSRENLEQQVLTRTMALREAEEQLRQSQKLEAVGQLTGGVAHDFNNLLTVIRGSVDLMQRPGITDERRERYIGAISETVTRATKLTGQLLAFARRQALQPDVFDVGGAIGAITDMVGTLTGSRIRVEMRMPDDPVFINADPSQFDTAIVNMVVNARDAMAGEGTLSIAVSAADAIPANGMPAVPGNFVAVAISDTGTGIAPDLLHQIFEPFYTTKGVGQGTGLGLSQVYGFAKQSGGEVRVASVPGRHTIFTLYLPAAPAPQEEAYMADAQRPSDGAGLCVLVVEDNPEVGSFARDALDELGFHAVFAKNGKAALEELKHDADRFDVVFSDVMMPGMTGVELGTKIYDLYPGLPVVLTSGYSQVIAEQGCAGFELLQKPYAIDELSRVLLRVARVSERVAAG